MHSCSIKVCFSVWFPSNFIRRVSQRISRLWLFCQFSRRWSQNCKAIFLSLANPMATILNRKSLWTPLLGTKWSLGKFLESSICIKQAQPLSKSMVDLAKCLFKRCGKSQNNAGIATVTVYLWTVFLSIILELVLSSEGTRRKVKRSFSILY